MGISYTGTITAGELLQVLSFLIAVFAAYNRISIKLAQLETKIQPIYDWWQDSINVSAAGGRHRHESD